MNENKIAFQPTSELLRLQKIIVNMAEEIDSLCRENSIQYYLLGGSAIGAIRHKGFIPWDDDLDIIMDDANYKKFISVCTEQLDKEKYYLQVGLRDWPLNFSKIRLKGTIFNEFEGYSPTPDMAGIYIDVFKMDNISANPIVARWQYLCGKYYLCSQLAERSYGKASIKKKVMMLLAVPLKLKKIREYVIKQTTMFNGIETKYWGFMYGRTRWRSGIIEKRIFGKPTYVPFENIMLPVPEKWHEYLTQVFGDYMKLPPIEQQRGLHMLSIDFGKY